MVKHNEFALTDVNFTWSGRQTAKLNIQRIYQKFDMLDQQPEDRQTFPNPEKLFE